MSTELTTSFIKELVRKELELLRSGDSTAALRTREAEKIADRYYKELGNNEAP